MRTRKGYVISPTSEPEKYFGVGQYPRHVPFESARIYGSLGGAKQSHKGIIREIEITLICRHEGVKGNYVDCPICGEMVR